MDKGLYEVVKEIPRIMRSRAGFRVVLHTEYRAVFQSNTCNGIVIQVHMGHFHIRIGRDGFR